MSVIDTDLFVATFRVAFFAENEVVAQVIADQMVEEIAEEHCLEEGESANLTQVTNTFVGTTPEELLVNFRATRNALIRTKLLSCFEVGREIDKIIQSLEHGDFQSLMPYDYSKFIELSESILVRGENPT